MGTSSLSALAGLDEPAPVDAGSRRGLLAMAVGFVSLGLLWVVPSVWLLSAGLLAHGVGLRMLRDGPVAPQARAAGRIWIPVAGLLGIVALWGSTLAVPLPGPDLVLHEATASSFALARATVSVVGPVGLAGVSLLAIWRLTGPVGHGVLTLSLLATGLVVLAVPLEVVEPSWLAVQPPLRLVPVALAGMTVVAVWEALRPTIPLERVPREEPG